ncbi:alpha/beta fold hydrolase [Conexibacter sp. W3-3-2]|nr:alpha/beta fold hydrolase [Conexibacter sp. W3-3-2]
MPACDASRMPRPGTRIVTVDEPQERGRHRGLAYTLFLPAEPRVPAGAVLVLHGAGSTKESHQDFARACREVGVAALCVDLRGHGESDGPMDGRAVEDVVALAQHLRARVAERCPAAPAPLPLALRGSSMGGWFALTAAAGARADAVVAICPASSDGLRRGLQEGRFAFAADEEPLLQLLAEHDPYVAAGDLGERLLLLHAEGDETVPVEHSRELHARAPGSRLIAVPGGHHRSIQHDAELQGVALRFVARRFRAVADGAQGSR